jgi:transcription termination/antitermination protein NusA
MNAEFIAVLEHMEREKGVPRSVILEAVEQALISAAHKVLKDKETTVDVKINDKSGDISVLSDGKKLESKEFGRIAAQTAKQVIIQKIREAERGAIFEEYHTKVNSIVSGTVYRYDKGALIVDLGKTEALLLKKEQTPRDNFRQGDRIKLYVLEVAKTTKGPQILVSRSNPGLVRKLFEMEVPEVLDGIVEIKEVARDPGDRSKIAVWSKDEKIDCVGACVGVRGMRVKNIVRELQGEKIDIVRWSEEIGEYVQAALSPAQCGSINVISKDDKRIEVIVDDDQLSLAIGKSGQNVRLAAKLTGWMIDIKSKKELANEKLGDVSTPTEEKTQEKKETSDEVIKKEGEETPATEIINKEEKAEQKDEAEVTDKKDSPAPEVEEKGEATNEQKGEDRGSSKEETDEKGSE